MPDPSRPWWVAGLLLVLWASGCSRDTCLSDRADCRVRSPCQQIQLSCASDTLEVRTLEGQSDRPAGLDGLGARGDVLLGNGQVVAVISAIGNQNYLDPNGGTILDLAPRGGTDGLNQVLVSVGIVPRDGARYTKLQLIDERPTRVAVQVSGTLDGRPDVPVYTLYELRACDRGLRVRTEILNATANQELWTLADVFYWSDREPLPFAPVKGLGFENPPFGLFTADDAYRRFPFMAAINPSAPHASYAEVACSHRELYGFQNDYISTAGHPKQVIPPRDYQVFERYLGVTPGKDVASAAKLAHELRGQLFGERTVELTGKVARVGALALDSVRETSVLLSEGTVATPASERVPWTQVIPDADGSFRALVPAGKTYVAEVHSFGVKRLEKDLGAIDGDQALGTSLLPSTARVTLAATDGASARPVHAEVFVVPVDTTVQGEVEGSLHGKQTRCAPWLGPANGGSPACNRILVPPGGVRVEVPMGRYHFYASKGPFWTLDRKTVTLSDGDVRLDFGLEKLPLQPAGTLGADLHVHSGISFDSSLPIQDRVQAFAAMDMDVLIATEHEVVFDYGDEIRRQGLQDVMSAVPGTETTAHTPFLRVPGDPYPRVIGHYIFWPLKYDPSLPRNGGPFDELVEPGELFDRVDELYWPRSVTPVAQLNHPWGAPYFGRDSGFPRAIHLDLRRDLPAADDGTNQGIYVRAPKGKNPNDGHQAQEVMNGTQNDTVLQYRAVWHYMLSQGRLVTGTANSDSHGLTDNTLGVPRNLVFTSTRPGPSFDLDAFNRAVREGRVLGTNGPVIEAELDNCEGTGAGRSCSTERAYGRTPIRPRKDAVLKLKVSAAPWVPVDEVRLVVNGKVVRAFAGAQLKRPGEPFGTAGLVRLEAQVKLSELLPPGQDSWLVVEAGAPLQLAKDLGGGLATKEFPDGAPDGVPDTGDNNGDGQVDAADVAVGESVGPLDPPPAPTDEGDPLIHYSRVFSGGRPLAFTNPFVLDVDQNGRFDAPGVEEAVQ